MLASLSRRNLQRSPFCSNLRTHLCLGRESDRSHPPRATRVPRTCTYSRYSMSSCANLNTLVKLVSVRWHGSSASRSPHVMQDATRSSVSRSVLRICGGGVWGCSVCQARLWSGCVDRVPQAKATQAAAARTHHTIHINPMQHAPI